MKKVFISSLIAVGLVAGSLSASAFPWSKKQPAASTTTVVSSNKPYYIAIYQTGNNYIPGDGNAYKNYALTLTQSADVLATNGGFTGYVGAPNLDGVATLNLRNNNLAAGKACSVKLDVHTQGDITSAETSDFNCDASAGLKPTASVTVGGGSGTQTDPIVLVANGGAQ